MGLKLSRSLALRDTAILKLRSLHSRAVFYGMTYDDILHERAGIFAALQPASAAAKAYVSGYDQHCRDLWYEQELVFCHVAPDGQRYTGWPADRVPEWARSVDPLYKQGMGSQIAEWPSAHFWLRSGKAFVTPSPMTHAPLG